MTFALTMITLSETISAGFTPIWVILMIVLLVVALFAWGVINSSGALGQPSSAALSQDDHHNDHH